MKAIIKKITFTKEWEGKFCTLFGFKVEYNDKFGYYSAKKKDQTKFIEGKEAEFTEETRTSQSGEYTIIKPIYNQGQSNYGRALKREVAKYSGFALAYSKDLVVAGKLDFDKIYLEADMMVDWMVAKDKEVGS